jgi:RNA polymerase sigma factor (sigma-70 family)
MSNDSVTAYFNEIARVPLLTTEQEIQLGRQIQEMRAFQAEGKEPKTQAERRIVRNGKRAMNRMMESNLRLVVTVARKYYRMCQTLELMDVISLGNMGLVKAAEKFDPSLGYKFSTYAYWWIWQAITRGVNDTDRLIRLPVHQTEKICKIKKHQREYPTATLAEAAAATGMALDELQIALRAWSLASLNEVMIEDGDELGSAVADHSQCPATALEQAVAIEGLQKMMDHLPPMDRRIVEMRYGLAEDSIQGEMTLAAIGKKLGVSRENVRKRERRSMNRLRFLLQVAA